VFTLAEIRSSRTISQVAKDLDLTESALRSWLEKAEEQSVPGALTLDEREELKRLRKENKRLEMEREILKNRQRSQRPSLWTRNSGWRMVEPLERSG
jgi:transposase